MDKNLNELIGKRIKELRKNKGYTQDGFFELLEIDSKHLSRVECAKVQPSLNLIKKMADVCGVKIEYFFKVGHLNSKEKFIEMINEMNEDEGRVLLIRDCCFDALDCHVACAPRNDGRVRHCERETRGNPVHQSECETKNSPDYKNAGLLKYFE